MYIRTEELEITNARRATEASEARSTSGGRSYENIIQMKSTIVN